VTKVIFTIFVYVYFINFWLKFQKATTPIKGMSWQVTWAAKWSLKVSIRPNQISFEQKP